MEKEVVWTDTSAKDFLEIAQYLKENWPDKVFDKFFSQLQLKVALLKHQPNVGHRSSKFSRFRKTLITRHYLLIYSVVNRHIVVHRLKHTSMK
jgi:addiction module RelE/StbE family toxin